MSTDANSKEMPDGVGKPTAEVSGSTLLNSPTWISGWRLYVIAFRFVLFSRELLPFLLYKVVESDRIQYCFSFIHVPG